MPPKVLLVATVKNEGPNILEWVAHHLLVGFDHIQVYQNDSTDETEKHLRTMARLGIIEYYRNDDPKGLFQNKAYRRARFTDAFDNCDWWMTLDADEFLHVRAGAGKVQDLISACEGADEILVNWRMFGNSHHRTLSDALVTERYTLADRHDRILQDLIGYKSLFKRTAFARPGIHRAKLPQIETPRVVNASGIPIDQLQIPSWRSTDPGLRKFAQINHYSLRDASSFLLKAARGSAGHVGRDVRLKYWEYRNFNDEEETCLSERTAPLREKMKELDEVSGGRLGFLKENSFRLWQEKLPTLLEDPEMRELYEALV